LAIVVAAAAASAVAAQPLPAIRDAYASERASRLGPDEEPTAVESWAARLGGARLVRFAFELSIEEPGRATIDARGTAELTLDGGRTTDFRIALSDGGATLVPATAAASSRDRGEVRTVDVERPAGAMDRVARYVVDLPVPRGPAETIRAEDGAWHFAVPGDGEHVYLRFEGSGSAPSRIVRIADGPTRAVLDLDDVSVR
jgi:hypothetical protein